MKHSSIQRRGGYHSMKNTRTSLPLPPATDTPNPPNTAVSDPILSWGSSVNVCEDLRRQISTEIESIESSISYLKNNLKNEERSSTQINKDLSHAQSEMATLARGAAEELDNASVNEQIRHRMAEALKLELVKNVVSPPNSPESISGDLTTEETGIGANDKNQKEQEAFPVYLARKKKQKNLLYECLRIDLNDLKNTKEKIQHVTREYTFIRQKLDSKDLAQTKCEAEREVESKQRENLKETKNLRNLKEGIQMARKRCGDYAQQIVDQV